MQRVVVGHAEAFRAPIERCRDAVFGVAPGKTGSFADGADTPYGLGRRRMVTTG